MNLADHYLLRTPGIVREYEPYEYDVDPSEEPGILGAAVRLRLSGLPDWHSVPKDVQRFVEKLRFLTDQLRYLTSTAPNQRWLECWNWSLDSSFTEYLWRSWTRARTYNCDECGAANRLDYCPDCEATRLGKDVARLLKRHRTEHRQVTDTERFMLAGWIASVDGSEYWDEVRNTEQFRTTLEVVWPDLAQIKAVIRQSLRQETYRRTKGSVLMSAQAPLPARAWVGSGGGCVVPGCSVELKGKATGYFPGTIYSCVCVEHQRGHNPKQCARCGRMGAPDSLGVCLRCIGIPPGLVEIPIVYQACTAQARVTDGRKPSMSVVNLKDASQFCSQCHRRLEWQAYKGGICPMCYQRNRRRKKP